MIIDKLKSEFEFTREWFMNEDNQVHTIQDRMIFHPKEPYKNEIGIGEHFLVDLIPKGDDVEIWEVENTTKEYYIEGRGKLQLKPIRKITTGKQFGYPNGYWKVPKEMFK